jgi:hypothetical protein
MSQIQRGRDLRCLYFALFRNKVLRVYLGFKKTMAELTDNSTDFSHIFVYALTAKRQPQA